ncbi:MAG: hypothetical protein GF350_08940 [Chitinivibrionales bacterium]|nr:hypothetical protein [Chitinivibrionales bacterium]
MTEELWEIDDGTDDKLYAAYGERTEVLGPLLSTIRWIGGEASLRELLEQAEAAAGPSDDGCGAWRILRRALELAATDLSEWVFVPVGTLARGVSCRWHGEERIVRRERERIYLDRPGRPSSTARCDPGMRVLIHRRVAQ